MDKWCVDFGTEDYPTGIRGYDNVVKAKEDFDHLYRLWNWGVIAECPKFLGLCNIEKFYAQGIYVTIVG